MLIKGAQEINSSGAEIRKLCENLISTMAAVALIIQGAGSGAAMGIDYVLPYICDLIHYLDGIFLD